MVEALAFELGRSVARNRSFHSRKPYIKQSMHGQMLGKNSYALMQNWRLFMK